MSKPRLTPPVITIGRVKRRMTGNATDGYRVRIDDVFSARIKLSNKVGGEVTQTNWYVDAPQSIVGGGFFKGCHEQAAANAIGAWFEARANGWGAPVVDRRAV